MSGDSPVTVVQWLAAARRSLAPERGLTVSPDAALLEADELLACALGATRGKLIALRSQALDAGARERADALLSRRMTGEPLAYIVGFTDFYGRRFEVRPGVLIPRNETEILVEQALARLVNSGSLSPSERAGLRVRDPHQYQATDDSDGVSPQARPLAEHNAAEKSQQAGRLHHNPLAQKILDLGTGSGCIIVTLLAELPHATGVATDLSPTPLQVTRRNADIHGVLDRLCLAAGDWFEALTQVQDCSAGILPGPVCIEDVQAGSPHHNTARVSFDLIVSNPPYVAAADTGLDEGVARFEPHEALFAPVGMECVPPAGETNAADGTGPLRRILEEAPRWLKPGGWLLMEMGAGQAQTLAALARTLGYAEVAVHQDHAGIERVLAARQASDCQLGTGKRERGT